ncbi:MAG: glycosyltransferase family 4 protein [Bryobacteraceae bacterium]|nr:glycosyltransferase family 4 protein [Bryobacteraceae bacterium]
MRIMICTFYRYPHLGGVSTHITELAEYLQAEHVDVTITSGNPPYFAKLLYLLSGALQKLGLKELFSFDYLATTVNANNYRRELATKLREERIDVLHAQDVISGSLAAKAVRELGLTIPIVLTVHGPMAREAVMSGAHPDSKLLQHIQSSERSALRHADHLIFVDKGQSDIARREHGDDLSDKTTILANAVNAEDYETEEGDDDRPSSGPAYFLVPRRLVHKNGVATAIEAIQLLKSKECQLRIAGSGPLLPELKLQAERCGLAKRIVFLGGCTRPQVIQHMRRAVGVIVPSIPVNGVEEATSLAALEATALGIPCIASDLGGLREIFAGTGVGFLYLPGNANQLAELLEKVQALNSEQRSLYAKRARQLIQSKYSRSQWGRRQVDVYRNVQSICSNGAK